MLPFRRQVLRASGRVLSASMSVTTPAPRRRPNAANIQIRDPAVSARTRLSNPVTRLEETRKGVEGALDYSPAMDGAKAFVIASTIVGGTVVATIGGAFVFLSVEEVNFMYLSFHHLIRYCRFGISG